jgi:hypothetical protein
MTISLKRPLLPTLALLAPLLLPAADEGKRPRIVGLSHIAISVHDVEKSRAFYKDFLGFDELFPPPNKDGTLHLTRIKINDRQTIELFPEGAADLSKASGERQRELLSKTLEGKKWKRFQELAP